MSAVTCAEDGGGIVDTIKYKLNVTAVQTAVTKKRGNRTQVSRVPGVASEHFNNEDCVFLLRQDNECSLNIFSVLCNGFVLIVSYLLNYLLCCVN